MRIESDSDSGALDPASLEHRLHAIDPPPVPEDLLDRCLATVPRTMADLADRPATRAGKSRGGWRGRLTATAAAVLLTTVSAIVTRPRPADAASLLQEVRQAEIRVAASHTVRVLKGTGDTRREEVWFARDRGRREEIRINDQPTATVVQTRRWVFRWDIRDHLVAAWSTELNAGHRGPNDSDGRVFSGEEMVRWAEKHRAEVHLESATLDGRKLRKITLRWPGPDSGGTFPRDESIWFEPDTLRPVLHQVAYDDGKSHEVQTDYPEPGAMPEDLFTFRPPPDVTIEINDPDLGRQVYSEGRTGGNP